MSRNDPLTQHRSVGPDAGSTARIMGRYVVAESVSAAVTVTLTRLDAPRAVLVAAAVMCIAVVLVATGTLIGLAARSTNRAGRVAATAIAELAR